MSNTETPPVVDSDGNPPNDIRALRDAAEDGKKARREADEAKRELAFLRAGVDLDSPLGKMFVKGYDGDLEPEAIKTAYAEIVPAAAPPAAAPPERTPLTPEQQAAGFIDPSQQQQHRDGAFGNGTPTGASEPQSKNPIDAAYERFHEMGRQGATMQERQEEALAIFFKAAMDGDSRVMFDPQAWQAKQIAGSRNDKAAPAEQ